MQEFSVSQAIQYTVSQTILYALIHIYAHLWRVEQFYSIRGICSAKTDFFTESSKIHRIKSLSQKIQMEGEGKKIKL